MSQPGSVVRPEGSFVPYEGDEFDAPASQSLPTNFVPYDGEEFNPPGSETRALMPNTALDSMNERIDASRPPITVESAGSFAEASRQRNAQLQPGPGSISNSNYDFDTAAAHKDDGMIARGAFKGAVNLQQQSLGLRRFVAEMTGDKRGATEMADEGARMTRMDTAAGEGNTAFEKNVVGATSSIISQMPGLVGGVVTGGGALVPLTMMGITTFGQEFENGRAAGKDFEKASERAGLYAVAEVIGEKFAVGSKMKAILGAAKGESSQELSHHLSKMLLAEIPGEQVTTLMEFLTDKNKTIGLNPNATLADYLQQVGQTFTQTITQSAMMGGAVGAIHAGRGASNAAGLTLNGGAVSEADAEQAKQQALAKASTMFSGMKPGAPAAPASADTSGVDPLTLEPIAPTSPSTPPAAIETARAAEEARQAALPPHEMAIDPANPSASIASIAAAPLPEIAPALATPAGVDEKTHATAAGDLAGTMAHIAALQREEKLTPPAGRKAIKDQIAALTEQGQIAKRDYSAQFGEDAGNHMHRVAAETFHSIKGDYRSLQRAAVPKGDVQEKPVSTEREQPAKVNTEPAAPARPVQRNERVLAPPTVPSPGTNAPTVGTVAPPITNAHVKAPAPTQNGPLDAAAHEAAASTLNDATAPTGPQAGAGNYKMGHVKFTHGGLDFSIENPSGSMRVDKSVPPKWQTRMAGFHYGYDRAAPKGADGDKIDWLWKQGTHPSYNGKVFVVDQIDQRTGKFDEHKFIGGVATEEAARSAYAAQYPKGWKVGTISTTSMQGYKTWKLTANAKQPFAAQPHVEAEPKAEVRNGVNATGTVNHQRAMRLHDTIERKSMKASLSEVRAHAKLVIATVPAEFREVGGRSLSIKDHPTLSGLIKDASDLGVPASALSGLDGFHLYRADSISENARHGHAPNGTRSIGFNDSLFEAASNGDKDAARSLLQVFIHELGHEVNVLGRVNGDTVVSTTSSSDMEIGESAAGKRTYGPVMQEMVDAYASDDTDVALREFLNYPLKSLTWDAQRAREGGFKNLAEMSPMIADEAFAQLHTLYYTQPSLMKGVLPKSYAMMKEVHDGLKQADNAAAGRQAVREAIRSTGPNVSQQVRPGVRFGETQSRDGSEQAATGLGEQLSERSRSYLEGRGKDADVRQSRDVREVSDKKVAKSRVSAALTYRQNDEKPLGKAGVGVDDVAKHFDGLVAKEFGGPLDFNNPIHFERAVAIARQEFAYQLSQGRSGLDWYSTDIKSAFEMTAKVIPELDDVSHRQTFTIVAALMSPATKAHNNWNNAAIAYKEFVDTGKVPEVDPENGALWGVYGRNTAQAIAHLNLMIEDMGREEATNWLLSHHTITEIKAMRQKYGMYKGDGTGLGGKALDLQLGLYLFGPKVGPFALNLNGISTEVTVDKWLVRTFHRYFGTLVHTATEQVGHAKEVPTNDERRAIKDMIARVASAEGYNNSQAQAVLWFFEQQVYTQLGAASPSKLFSDGARDFLDSHGIDHETTGQGTDVGGERAAQAATGTGQETELRAQRSLAEEGSHLEGLPAASVGSNAVAQLAAQEYMDEAGLPYDPPTAYVKVDPAYSARIADAYGAMKHAPNDPAVKAAYRALIDETVAQWHAMIDTGLTVTFTSKDRPYPYALPYDASRDVRDNNSLTVYSTDEGFGNDGDADTSDNPLLEKTDIVVDGKRLVANDVFRAVHDYFGHVKDGVGFRADGEENAWRSHAAMFSPLARMAMTSETRGQNSFVNYGPHGEKNRTAKTEDTVFGEQKAGLLPAEFSADRYEEMPSVEFRKSLTEHDFGTLTPEQRQALKNTGGIVEKRTIAEKYASMRKGIGLKITQGVSDQFAPLKNLDQHAYLLSRLSKGSDGALEAIMTYGNLSLIDGVTDSDARGTGLIENLRKLKGEHHRFMQWVAAHRAETLTREDREHLFSRSDITALKTLADDSAEFPNRRAMYMEVLKDYNAASRNVLDIAEQSGIIDPASRKIWEKEFYVPFYRAMEDDTLDTNISRAPGLVRQYAFQKLKGGKDKLNQDLLANVLMNWSHLLSASAKNRASSASLEAAVLANIARRIPDGEHVPKGSVWSMEGGKKVNYEVSDPLVLDAITSLGASIVGGQAGKFLSQMKVALTVGVTANPAFKIRNLMRDSISAISQSELSLNVPGNVIGGIKAMGHKSQVRASMLAGGGMIRFGTMLEGNRSSHVSKLVNAGVKDSTILDSKEKFKDAVQVAWDYYNELGDISENSNRASLYKQMMAAGKSHAEASLAARDLLDFSKGGSWGAIRFLTQTVPFLNARIQGLFRLGQGMRAHPQRFASVLGATALASIALMLAYDDDDDWKAREDWDRDNYWWFKIGSTAFRIPKPFEVGVMATLAERGVELFTNNEMTAARFRDRLQFAISNTFAMNPAPQLFKPMLDIYANVDSFTGRPIEQRGQEALSKSERYGPRTSELAKLLGPATGAANLSPTQVDHLVKGYFGWLGTMALTATSAMLEPFTNGPSKPSPLLRDAFLVGNFAEDLPAAQSRYVTQFYNQAKEVEQAYADYKHALKTGDKEKARDLKADNATKIAAEPRVAAFQREMDELTTQSRAIENNRTMDGDMKRTKLNLISAKRNSLAERAARVTSRAVE